MQEYLFLLVLRSSPQSCYEYAENAMLRRGLPKRYVIIPYAFNFHAPRRANAYAP